MKHSKIKQAIIETASELFYKNGYNLTGINEIIAEAGIAKATLYNHFASKEELCIAYLQHRSDELIVHLNDYCKTKPEGKSRVMGIVEFLIPFFESGDFNGCWCLRTISEIPYDNQRIRIEIQKHKKELLDFITELIAQNLPHLDTVTRENLSKRTYLIYESAVMESHLQKDAWPIHAGLSLLGDLIN